MGPFANAVGVAPYATARVGPYTTFTYATAPGIPPHPTGGVAPAIATGVSSHTTGNVAPLPPGVAAAPPHERIAGVGPNETGVPTLATGLAFLERAPSYGTGVAPNATPRMASQATTRLSSAPPSKIAPRGMLFD